MASPSHDNVARPRQGTQVSARRDGMEDLSNNIGIPERRSQKRKEEKRDLDWLSEATAREPSMRGYLVVIDLSQSPKALLCIPVAKGVVEPEWVIE